MHIVVIGAGAAGLTAAAKFAISVHKVTVFDHNAEPGGVLMGWHKDDYHWDLGQLLVEGMGADEPIGEVLTDLEIFDQVKTRKDDRRYVFPDFSITKPAQYTSPDWRIKYLKTIFPEDSAGLDRYWVDYLRFTKLMAIGRKLGKASGLKGFWLKLQLIKELFPFMTRQKWNATQLMESYFSSEKLRSVFTSILADFFTPPSQFLGLGVFALNPEPSFDARMEKFLPNKGEQIFHYSLPDGTTGLVDAFVESIYKNGGEIQVNTDITKINLEDGKVHSVETSHGETILADVVVASGGAKETFLHLVGEDHLSPEFILQVNELPLMDSIFMVHLGLDFDPTPYTGGVCTYYYGTYDIEGGILENQQHRYHQGRLGFVTHSPSFRSDNMAPAGCHALTIYTICPNQLAEGDWITQKEFFADQIIQYAQQHIPDLDKHILVREILTPLDFRQLTHTGQHAFGGLSPVMTRGGIPHKTPVAGLWFIGQQSDGGGGLGNVITHAHQTAKTVLKS
ncbi:MAG: NAD(P)/FAD-dependent oxidoreductase [Anaerolineaceae bacterium]|nr:NAD(P)/FAD-dependent oxidoreductase [Anaerolineaceae bacterium]